MLGEYRTRVYARAYKIFVRAAYARAYKLFVDDQYALRTRVRTNIFVRAYTRRK